MTKQLEFMDCPNCGKRVPMHSTSCYRCNAVIFASQKSVARDERDSESESESHMSAGYAGYDEGSDDFDYDEFLENEFGGGNSRPTAKPWWWYVAWMVLIVTIVGIVAECFIMIRIPTHELGR